MNLWDRILSFIRRFWEAVRMWFSDGRRQLDANQAYVLMVDEARKDWLMAQKMLQEVQGNNLVDQAIYYENAAQRKYVHLLKQAGLDGVTAEMKTVVYLALAARNNGF